MTAPTTAAAPARAAEPAGQRRRFLMEFLRRPFQVGAVAPSSPRLARLMVDELRIDDARVVVEVGPGTGAFTDELRRRLPPACRYVGVEINSTIAAILRERHPDLEIVNDDASNLRAICARAGVDGVDRIISGLPWASFPDDLQIRILDAMTAVLKPGGVFVTFGYHIGTVLPAGRRFYRRLPTYFPRVSRTPYIWRNVPPAFAVRCER